MNTTTNKLWSVTVPFTSHRQIYSHYTERMFYTLHCEHDIKLIFVKTCDCFVSSKSNLSYILLIYLIKGFFIVASIADKYCLVASSIFFGNSLYKSNLLHITILYLKEKVF